jgi:hypothetical protein
MTLNRLIDARSSLPLFVLGIFAAYAVIPRLVFNLGLPDDYFVDLSNLALVSCLAMCLGYSLPLFDSRFRKNAGRIKINAKRFHFFVWAGFLLFLAVTFLTASDIPILSAIHGASVTELDAQRGAFLKGRTGLEAILPYLGTLFVSALLPYSLVSLFFRRSRLRYLALLIFLGFSVSFLVKSLFLNVAFPLLYFMTRRRKITITKAVPLIGLGFVVLYVVSKLALANAVSAENPVQGADVADFFKTTYRATGLSDFLVWRAIAVPVFTAADTLRVFAEQLGGESLFGATSSFISAIFGFDRVPLEKMVYAHEFGWNDLANANAVFITDAFVNLGWTGVVLFSMFVGQSLRWFRKSSDVAFQALWMNYCFGLYGGSLIGILLSNGYLLMFCIALFVKLDDKPYRRVAERRASLSGAQAASLA